MWAWLADRLVFCPSRDPIACESERRWIDWERGRFEAWVQRTNRGRDVDLLVLKFPGTGGRAERSSTHPADCWDDLGAEVWTVNPPGYGGSPGRPSMRTMAAVAEAAWQAVSQAARGCPIVVTGNSLGTLSALYLAAHVPIAGLLIRNPVPLRDLILHRHGKLASIIARRVPSQMCPIRNAAQATAPAVIVTSGKDRVVPPKVQQLVIGQYAGPHRIITLPQADHADPPDDEEFLEYAQQLAWLRQRAIGDTTSS
jgi:pimeloyl-ACP methyl ester carboxylesterase